MCPSGLDKSPSDSTDTERSVRKSVPPNAWWNPCRKGEFENARPPLCPGVCQFVPAFTFTYCRSAVEKRGIQKLLKRWTRRSWCFVGDSKICAAFFVQRRAGSVTSAWPERVRTTFGIAGKKSLSQLRRVCPSTDDSSRSSSIRKRQHARPASVSTPRGPPLVKSAFASASVVFAVTSRSGG